MAVINMASASIWEFLENSTIHGLVHVSTAKSRAARAGWVAIVVSCFSIAISMITSSYKEWQESPVSTTITTHLITELEFPAVTVCPPRGSNTALNHLLEKVKDVNFTDEERNELLDISKEVFLEIPNKKHAEHMTELLSTENMRSIANGQARMPEIDEQGMITIKTYELHGSFQTPGFRDPEYKGDFYSRPHSLHYVLNFPDNMKEMLGDGALVISVETNGNWSFTSPGTRLKYFDEKMNMTSAEEFCVKQGGHLASIGSQRRQEEIEKLARRNIVWLGAKRKTGEEALNWLDGQKWDYENWAYHQPYYGAGFDCLVMKGERDWQMSWCHWSNPFICDFSSNRMSGNHTLVFRNTALTNSIVHFWWNHTHDSSDQNMLGFHINWRIENGTIDDARQFESTSLSGEISTLGFDTLPPPNNHKERQEYTAVIELPHNITDIIGDSALVVDVDIVPDDQRQSGVELLLDGETKLEFNEMGMNWSDAEEFCISKGGHLASVASHFHWHRLQSFIENLGLNTQSIWLGGTDEAEEGEWVWTDGSKWSEEYWNPTEPTNSSHQNCLDSWKSVWYDDSCQSPFMSICSLPTKIGLTSKTQVVFTSENISRPAIHT